MDSGDGILFFTTWALFAFICGSKWNNTICQRSRMKTFCKYAIYCVVWWHKSSLCAVFSLSDITRVIKACFSVYFSLLYTKYSQSKLNKVNTGTSFIDSSFTALFFSLCDIPWLLVHQRDNKTKQNKTKDANSIWEYQLNDLLVVRQQNPSTMSPERRA